MPLQDFEELVQDGRAVVGISATPITAENTFTDEFIPLAGRNFAFSIRSTDMVATVSVQHSMDDGVTWSNLEQYTSPTEGVASRTFHNERFRIGIETGNYTSGTVTVEVKQ